MTAIDTAQAPPFLAGTQSPPRRAPLPLLNKQPSNSFETIPIAAFEEPVWEHRSLFQHFWLVSDPAGLKHVLLDNVANYPKTPMENRFFRALFGDGLLSREGEAWRSHRRIMSPSFDPRSVSGYAEAMAGASAAFADGWMRLTNGSEVDVSAEMTALTLEIISRTMFSGDAAEMTAMTGAALHQGQEAAFEFNLLDILPIIGAHRLVKREAMMAEIFAPMDGALHRLIAARLADPAKTDLLGRLVAALDEDTGARMTVKEVRDEVLTIFVAGHETTASAMTFVWYLLSQHPAEEAKLHAELAAVLGGRAPTDADVPKLVYTRRVIEEAMRIYPPAPGLSARVALKADEVAGHRIPAGGSVMLSPWVLHRHRTLWSNPERFDPDRFSAERSVGRQRFSYMPFGAGPRVCIGQMLAMTEATLILATLAQRYRLRLKPGHEVQIQNRVTIRPKDGLPMIIERR